MRGATLFSGGGGVELGMQIAGIDPVWGIELEDKIAQVARNNGFHVTTGDVTQEDPANYPEIDVLHASPPCTRASVANVNKGETELDAQLAQATLHFVEVLRPQFFTLENVRGYTKFACFENIVNTLQGLGYGVSYRIYNAADFGVPQYRYRLFLLAVKNDYFMLPDFHYPHVSWWSMAQELLTEKTELTGWQKERLSGILDGTYILESQKGSLNGVNAKPQNKPCFTISSSIKKRNPVIYTHNGIYRATPEIIKRIQSFPDNYQLPASRQLAYHILGNSVPPLMYGRIMQTVRNYYGSI